MHGVLQSTCKFLSKAAKPNRFEECSRRWQISIKGWIGSQQVVEAQATLCHQRPQLLIAAALLHSLQRGSHKVSARLCALHNPRLLRHHVQPQQPRSRGTAKQAAQQARRSRDVQSNVLQLLGQRRHSILEVIG